MNRTGQNFFFVLTLVLGGIVLGATLADYGAKRAFTSGWDMSSKEYNRTKYYWFDRNSRPKRELVIWRRQ